MDWEAHKPFCSMTIQYLENTSLLLYENSQKEKPDKKKVSQRIKWHSANETTNNVDNKWPREFYPNESTCSKGRRFKKC